jgi:flagellar hook-basal body complex protein FliE
MAINTNMIGAQAANLYQNTANIASMGMSASREDQVSFGSLFKAGLEKIVETQEKSETVSQAAVIGKANITDVVEAVTEAEVVLKTAVTVRDKMIGAYQEIMSMPI